MLEISLVIAVRDHCFVECLQRSQQSPRLLRRTWIADRHAPRPHVMGSARGEISAGIDNGVTKTALAENVQRLVDDISLADTAKIPGDIRCRPIVSCTI